MTYTKTEKVQALVEGRGLQIMIDDNPGTIADFWKDVSFSDVIKYADEHGIPEDICYHEPGTGDGIYIIKSENTWSLYSQERGIKYGETSFPSEKEVIYGLLSLIAHNFRIAGTK